MSAWRTLGALAMLAHQATPPNTPQDASPAAVQAACTASVNGMGLSQPPTLAQTGRLIRYDCDRYPAAGDFLAVLTAAARRDGLLPPSAPFHQQAVLLTAGGFTSRFWLFRFQSGTPPKTITLIADQFGQMDEAEDVADEPLLKY